MNKYLKSTLIVGFFAATIGFIMFAIEDEKRISANKERELQVKKEAEAARKAEEAEAKPKMRDSEEVLSDTQKIYLECKESCDLNSKGCPFECLEELTTSLVNKYNTETIKYNPEDPDNATVGMVKWSFQNTAEFHVKKHTEECLERAISKETEVERYESKLWCKNTEERLMKPINYRFQSNINRKGVLP